MKSLDDLLWDIEITALEALSLSAIGPITFSYGPNPGVPVLVERDENRCVRLSAKSGMRTLQGSWILYTNDQVFDGIPEGILNKDMTKAFSAVLLCDVYGGDAPVVHIDRTQEVLVR
jgi:hypothetical protein